eukprot:8402310-Alexandrium_andersonii.AAC.1
MPAQSADHCARCLEYSCLETDPCRTLNSRLFSFKYCTFADRAVPSRRFPLGGGATFVFLLRRLWTLAMTLL